MMEWTGTEPIPCGKTLLLEASAGTGKTWQIEGLVTRLVAEYDLAIDRILVITFTNAATAELRDRIRRRLIVARDAMGSDKAPKDDPIVLALWHDVSLRVERQSRLARAVSSFDLAPISTIHGFSQRMLDQLAFESGQEPGLSLLMQPDGLIQQQVDDHLASVYARATVEQLTLLSEFGWTPKALTRVAAAMTQAVGPVVEPEDLGLDPVQVAERCVTLRAELLGWFSGDEGVHCVEALRFEAAKKKGKRLKGVALTKMNGFLSNLQRWLAQGAARSERLKGTVKTAVTKLSREGLAAMWTDDAASLEAFDAIELYNRVDAFIEAQDALSVQPLVYFATRVRAQVNAELERTGQLTYGSMLSRLSERVQAEREAGGDGLLTQAIRSRFDVALVDEFQDTDGAQWPVMREVFSHPERRLLIIGDPKQAIYAFRGADVHIYLDAARVASERATMNTNWRSDADFIQAMNHLWHSGSDAFELDEVDYVTVGSAPAHKAARLRGAPEVDGRRRRAFELRWVDASALDAPAGPIGNKERAAELICDLASQEAASLLETGCEVKDGDHWRPLEPGDIAILVRTNRQAVRLGEALDARGIPSVSAGRGRVFQSPVLPWLCAWLDAVADPGAGRSARTLATTPLFGWSAVQLARVFSAHQVGQGSFSPEQRDALAQWERWLQRIRGWSEGWRRGGFVRVFEFALDGCSVLERLLSARKGERHATDLRHLVELCHAEERRTRVGPSGLARWLRTAAQRHDADETASLRLESDARAVQLVTIHTSKGLEYPVVLLPFAWDDRVERDGGGPLEWHAKRGNSSEIRLNLGPKGSERRSEVMACVARESRQEQRRLLYVALTRARHHCVAWIGSIGSDKRDQASYGLGCLSLRPRDLLGVPLKEGGPPVFPPAPRSNSKPATIEKNARLLEQALEDTQAALQALCETSGGTIGFSVACPVMDRGPCALLRDEADILGAKAWPSDRELRSPWVVSSYTRMASGRRHEQDEPRRISAERAIHGEGVDRPAQDVVVELAEPANASALEAPIATAALAGGPEVGTWVHAVFETLDFARDGSDNVEDAALLAEQIAQQGQRNGVRDPEQHAHLLAALPAMLRTSLSSGSNGLPEGFSLRSIARADRLDEMAFDLRLGAGAAWRPQQRGGVINVKAALSALALRRDQTGWGGEDWLNAMLKRGEETGGFLPEIPGILTGFIDLVFRVRDADGVERYYLADYKTNRIAPSGQRRDSRLYHYTQPWMAWEMAHHGYHLQSLLYTLALHRFLNQRVADYDYEVHIGGHLYLFLRGMSGSQASHEEGALGVYADRWPAAVVYALDAALSGQSPQAGDAS